MKALTLWEPWASFVADGFKRFETRHWTTQYRGLLAIHASSRWEREQARMFQYLRETYPELHVYPQFIARETHPFGCVVAIAELIAIRPTVVVRDEISSLERALGDYSDGRYAWEMKLVEKLAVPVRVRGSQGLWEWTR